MITFLSDNITWDGWDGLHHRAELHHTISYLIFNDTYE